MKLNKEKFNRVQHLPGHVARQQGFVLVLVLVLLAVLTLIGVSSMNSSNMELKATANARQHHVAFNAVQSVLEFAVSTQDPVLIDFQTTTPVAQVVTYPAADATKLKAKSLQAESLYVGCAASVGNSIQKGKGFSSNFFNITGTGTNAAGTASSRQVQGIRFPAASCL